MTWKRFSEAVRADLEVSQKTLNAIIALMASSGSAPMKLLARIAKTIARMASGSIAMNRFAIIFHIVVALTPPML
eukprot:567227-Amphidinium_carterae.1